MTDRYAVIGNPIAHSKSPAIHARFARQTGQDIEYGRLLAPVDGFAQAVDAFRAAVIAMHHQHAPDLHRAGVPFGIALSAPQAPAAGVRFDGGEGCPRGRLGHVVQ